MPATENINIRLSPQRKAALQELAAAFGESVTDFLLKSVQVRVRAEAASTGQEDPFVVALRTAAKSRRQLLTPTEKAAVTRSRQARARGKERLLGIPEARRRILEAR
jgi:uncharacterized protein (DUF1778 family)